MPLPNTAWFLPWNHLFLLNYRGDGPGRTIESADMLVHPSALELPDADARIDRVLDYWAMVNQQDIEAVEKVQKGLESRACRGGRMCLRIEEPIHRFQNMVIDLMVGLEREPAGDEAEQLKSSSPVIRGAR